MKVPQITGYRLEEVQLPAPKDEEQVIREALGLTERIPPGPGRKMIRITLEADDEFPIVEMPLAISIGDQVLTGLAVSGGQASAFIETMPQDGEQIVFHAPFAEGGTVLAGHFDSSKLDTGIA